MLHDYSSLQNCEHSIPFAYILIYLRYSPIGNVKQVNICSTRSKLSQLIAEKNISTREKIGEFVNTKKNAAHPSHNVKYQIV